MHLSIITFTLQAIVKREVAYKFQLRIFSKMKIYQPRFTL